MCGLLQRGARGSVAALGLAVAACASSPETVFCPANSALVVDRHDAVAEHWCRDARGREHGPYLRLSSQGVELQRGWYEHGTETGAWLVRLPDGRPDVFIVLDREGRPSGPYFEWYENGALRAFERYDETGLVESWSFFRDGRHKSRLPYEHGSVHGQVTTWHADGSLRTSCRLEHGVRRECARWEPGEHDAIAPHRAGEPVGEPAPASARD